MQYGCTIFEQRRNRGNLMRGGVFFCEVREPAATCMVLKRFPVRTISTETELMLCCTGKLTSLASLATAAVVRSVFAQRHAGECAPSVAPWCCCTAATARDLESQIHRPLVGVIRYVSQAGLAMVRDVNVDLIVRSIWPTSDNIAAEIDAHHA